MLKADTNVAVDDGRWYRWFTRVILRSFIEVDHQEAAFTAYHRVPTVKKL